MGNYRKKLGAYGEEQAVDYLRKSGYRIIEQNFMCRTGEVDIIAQQMDMYVFVEVKTRRDIGYGRPIEAITPQKLRSFIKSVEVYRKMKHLYDVPIRIDAIEVVVAESGTCSFNQIENITM